MWKEGSFVNFCFDLFPPLPIGGFLEVTESSFVVLEVPKTWQTDFVKGGETKKLSKKRREKEIAQGTKTNATENREGKEGAFGGKGEEVTVRSNIWGREGDNYDRFVPFFQTQILICLFLC